MPFDNPSNHSRAEKIAEIVAHVKKSAESNKAPASEIAEIMAPAVDALRALGAIEAGAQDVRDETPPPARPEPSAPPAPGGKWAADRNAPAWAIIRDAAASAPLQDLAAAMTVYTTRIDDALHTLKEGRP